MNITCPHCGTEYDIAQNEFGKFVTCQICGKGFVAGAKAQAKSAEHGSQTSRSPGTADGHASARQPQKEPSLAYKLGKLSARDEAYATPVVAKIFQLIGYVIVVLVGIALFVGAMMANPLVALFVVLPSIALGLLAVRLWYELCIVIFDGVGYLRDIRDELRSRRM